MKRMIVLAVLAVSALFAGAAIAQDASRILPLDAFVGPFTDQGLTSAQKQLQLPPGTWYEGIATVTDVEYYKEQGAEPAFAEIRDENYRGGCFLLIFRTQDTAKALTLKIDEKVRVRGRLADTGVHLSRFLSGCETRFALFKDTEILGVAKPKP